MLITRFKLKGKKLARQQEQKKKNVTKKVTTLEKSTDNSFVPPTTTRRHGIQRISITFLSPFLCRFLLASLIFFPSSDFSFLFFLANCICGGAHV
jgi:hypothetical protein